MSDAGMATDDPATGGMEAVDAAGEDFDQRTAELAPLYAAAGATLSWGFRFGAVLLAAGLALAVARDEPLPREAEPFAEIGPALVEGRSAGIIDAALLWLVATPVAAVLVVAVGFVRLRDRRYAGLSLLVLAVLGVSIGLALAR